MSRSEMAAGRFLGGFNCAAAVITEFCEDYDLDTELAAKLACGMGAGFCDGDICGAVSAAVMVVGLMHGQSSQDDQAAKINCRAKTVEFLDAFKRKHGVVACRDLLAGFPDDDSEEAVQERRRFCAGLVDSAVEILEELGY